MKYQTKNKTQILDILKDNKDKHLTMEEIKELSSDIPQASVYRIVDALTNEGRVRRYLVDNNQPACYQYIDEEERIHFHLLCSKCGKLIHLECHEVNKLIEHIKEEHGFEVDISKVNLYGICKECSSQ